MQKFSSAFNSIMCTNPLPANNILKHQIRGFNYFLFFFNCIMNSSLRCRYSIQQNEEESICSSIT